MVFDDRLPQLRVPLLADPSTRKPHHICHITLGVITASFSSAGRRSVRPGTVRTRRIHKGIGDPVPAGRPSSEAGSAHHCELVRADHDALTPLTLLNNLPTPNSTS